MQTTGRGTRPAKRRGAHGRAPAPLGQGAARLGRARPTGLTARHHFHSKVAPIMPGFPARPCFARAGPPFLWWRLRRFPPSQLGAGALPAVPPHPLAGGVGPAPRARRARACAPSRLHPPLGPPWSAVRRTAHLFPPIPHPMPSAQAPVRPVARPPTGTEGTPRRSAPWPCPTKQKKKQKRKGVGVWGGGGGDAFASFQGGGRRPPSHRGPSPLLIPPCYTSLGHRGPHPSSSRE